jgi:polyisoprenoid-binding protein YceI
MNRFKSIYTVLFAAAFFAISGFTTLNSSAEADAMSWEIDPAHSNLSFQINHFFTPVTGKFKDYKADVNFSPDNLEESSIDIKIMVNSIDTDNQKRDGHLQSDDFFNAEKYPSITFSSDKITSAEGENMFTAHGELTIKDVTKQIKLPFKLLGIQDHPMKENTKVAGIKIDHQLNRTDYDVGVGDWAATAVVGDEVDLNIALEMQHSMK